MGINTRSKDNMQIYSWNITYNIYNGSILNNKKGVQSTGDFYKTTGEIMFY